MTTSCIEATQAASNAAIPTSPLWSKWPLGDFVADVAGCDSPRHSLAQASGWQARMPALLQLPRRCPVRRLAKARGFTIIELIVIIAVIGIIATVAIVSLSSVQAQRDRMAAQELVAHLQYARNLTLSRERNTKIVFTVTSNSYSVFIADTNGVYSLAKDPVTQADWIVNISDRFSGVELASVDINGVRDPNELRFSETNGIPCDINGAELAANGTITFLSGYIVTVTPDTGYVSIQ